MVSDKVVSNFNVFSSRVNYQVFCDFFCVSVVPSYWDNSKIYTVVTDLLFHPNKLSATSTRNNVSPPAMDNTTLAYFLLCHETSDSPSKCHVSLVPFLSNIHPAKWESEYPTKSQSPPFEHHKPMCYVSERYLIMRLTILRCDSFGYA